MEINESIIFRSGLTMGGIVLLALLSMISSVFIAESSKGDAAAINLAGSLRMQSYRIATRLQQSNGKDALHIAEVKRETGEFEHRLGQLWRTGAISQTESDSRNRTLTAIESFWRETMKPTLENTLENLAAGNPPSADFLGRMDSFVARLDAFVKLLEQDTEAKIRLLRLVQGIALFMILILIFAAMHQLHGNVVAPLRDLVELARKAQHGDLSVRASHVGKDELGELGHAFNLMAADLEAMYADLEARVDRQTQALRVSNRSLELLYHTANSLSENAPNEVSYRTLMAEIEKLTGTGSVTLCLIHPSTLQASRVFSAWASTSIIPPFCSRPNCEACIGDGGVHRLGDTADVYSIPIRDQEHQYGVLMVRNPSLEGGSAWQLPLLETVARHIATALRAAEQAEHRRRLELLEERGAIARELHDSLAQSLSYLKIQISRLQTLLGGAETSSDVRDIVAELREGLNGAYRQLRELITTFRLKMEHPRLESSLRDAVREFSRRAGLNIELDHADWHCALDPNEQIHVMQIVSEALNNAVKHARANHIAVRMHNLDDGEAIIDIRDDGVGLPPDPERDYHFGLNIMRERARHLGGNLDLQSQPAGGLRVRLQFVPTACRKSSIQTERGARHA